jgi:hypothetical protein
LKEKVDEYLREIKEKGEELREKAEEKVEDLKEMAQESIVKVWRFQSPIINLITSILPKPSL